MAFAAQRTSPSAQLMSAFGGKADIGLPSIIFHYHDLNHEDGMTGFGPSPEPKSFVQ